MGRTIAAVCVVVWTMMGGCGSPDGSGTTSGSPSSPSSAPSSSRAAENPAAGDHSLSLDVGGTNRTYLLHAPPGYAPGTPRPLVIAMHFRPGSGRLMRDMSGLDALADQHGFLVAYPDGTGGEFNAMMCCGEKDDVRFLKELTAHLVTTWKADADRVYLTGISNGGDMSFRAAVEATGVFAAIGVVSGGFIGTRAAAADFAPRSPVSVVTILGTADRQFTVLNAGVTTWQQRLRCTPAPVAGAPTGVSHSTARCADGSDVDVYLVTGMGHVWPGAAGGPLAQPDAPLNATATVWQFFAAHPRIR